MPIAQPSEPVAPSPRSSERAPVGLSADTDAVDLTCNAVELSDTSAAGVESGSRSEKRCASATETMEKVKRAALQQRGMQIDAQLQHGGSLVPASGGVAPPSTVRDDADMGEEPDDGWLQKETATVLSGFEVHLIERMLFRSPKVTFGLWRVECLRMHWLDVRNSILAE